MDSDHESFAQNVLTNVFDMWIIPEVERRNGNPPLTEVFSAVVEIGPGAPALVYLNHEAEIEVASDAGTALLSHLDHDSIEGLAVLNFRPVGINPDSGWIAFVRVGGDSGMVAFDFRYNKPAALALLDKAEHFLRAAEAAAKFSADAALDNAHSAAELTIQAQMLLEANETHDHRERRDWMASWVKHDNAPQSHRDVLVDLIDKRKIARYGAAQASVSAKRMKAIVATVTEMIDYARAHTGVK